MDIRKGIHFLISGNDLIHEDRWNFLGVSY